jgi:hypothetical protein
MGRACRRSGSSFFSSFFRVADPASSTFDALMEIDSTVRLRG